MAEPFFHFLPEERKKIKDALIALDMGIKFN
jgi:hypothetical protein